MHIRLVLINQTTIEAYEKRPLQPWPYDRGWKKNFIDVFGRKKKLWLLPIIPEEHRRRLLAETLDTVAVPVPALLETLNNNNNITTTTTTTTSTAAGTTTAAAAGNGGNFSSGGRAVSPSDESVSSSDLGMVLIERPTSQNDQI
jgi:hypothetical protein